MQIDTIKITIPHHIPHGRKSSVLKGIIAELTDRMGPGTTDQSTTPEGHENAIRIGKNLAAQIERAVEERVAR
jgi:hypothetical protein